MSRNVDLTNGLTIRTRRGNLRVQPDGNITGLWQVMRRELRTNSEVRDMCGFRQRHTLLRWRNDPRNPFPAPVMTLAGAHPMELWSRSQVETWLEQTAGRRQGARAA